MEQISRNLIEENLEKMLLQEENILLKSIGTILSNTSKIINNIVEEEENEYKKIF